MKASRRQFINIATTGLVFAGGLAILPQAKATGRQPKKTVAFQDKPSRSQKCGNCRLFKSGDIKGGSCLVVAGPVTASSWCVLWETAG
jgi:hypothetical protein